MRPRRRMSIRKVPNQFKRNNRPNPRRSAAHPANGRHRSALKQIRRQHIRNRRKRSVSERRDRKQQCDQPQLHGKNRRNQQHHAKSTKHHHRLPRSPHRPSALDQNARNPTAKKIPQIGSQKRNPHRHQPVLQRNSLRHEKNRKPVRHKKPDRIGQPLRNQRPPRLRQLE